MRWLATALITATLAIGLFAAWEAFRFLLQPNSPSAQEVVFEVRPGEGLYAVAERLAQQGLIKNADYFKLYALLTGRRMSVRVGEYALNTALRPRQVLEILSSGRSIERQFTIPEGWNMFEIAALMAERGIISREEALKLFQSPTLILELLGEKQDSLEGYLFPSTYKYTKYTSAEDLIRLMVRSALKSYDEAHAQRTVHGFSRHQIFTLASVIEKETGAPEERPLIGSVFHNRLAKGMRLQSDPTILYGILIATGVMPENIRRADILAPTPFNTYTVKSLPRGPIANAGAESLRAALRPASSNYFYFVSRNDGTHVFSQTFAEHNQAVRKFQMDPRARQGKSWRDLQKRSGSASR